MITRSGCPRRRQGKTVVDGDADGSAKERTLAVIEKIKVLQQERSAKASAEK